MFNLFEEVFVVSVIFINIGIEVICLFIIYFKINIGKCIDGFISKIF